MTQHQPKASVARSKVFSASSFINTFVVILFSHIYINNTCISIMQEVIVCMEDLRTRWKKGRSTMALYAGSEIFFWRTGSMNVDNLVAHLLRNLLLALVPLSLHYLHSFFSLLNSLAIPKATTTFNRNESALHSLDTRPWLQATTLTTYFISTSCPVAAASLEQWYIHSGYDQSSANV